MNIVYLIAVQFKTVIIRCNTDMWAGITQSLYGLAMGWKVRGLNPGGGEIFHTRPHRRWGLPSVLYSGYRVSLPGVNQPGSGVNHPLRSSAEVKERVDLYLYSPSG